MFLKKNVLKNFSKFAGKHLCQSLFFNKVAGLSKMERFAKIVNGEKPSKAVNYFHKLHLR